MEWWAEIATTTPRTDEEYAALVRACAGAGFTHVKIPLRGPRWAPGARADEAALRRCWLSPRRAAAVASMAREHDLGVVVSCHYRGDVRDAVAISGDVKIGSYELTDLALIRALAARPEVERLTMSTGGATVQEIDAALAAWGRPATLLYTVSAYPAHPSHVDLSWLERLRRRDCRVGYSDHTRNAMVVRLAVAAGASIVELHVAHGCSAANAWEWSAAAAAVVDLESAEFVAPFAAPRERLWRADPSDGRRPMLAARRQR